MTKASVIGGFTSVAFIAVAVCVFLRSGATRAPAIPAAADRQG